MFRCYSELILFPTFEERFEYLKLSGSVGSETFGVDRYLNQIFYRSLRWKKTRRLVIARDFGLDLGVEGYDISGTIMIHHMNPVTIEQVEEMDDILFDLEYLISTSVPTHEAIHYGDKNLLPRLSTIRRPGDTKLW